MHQPNPDVMLRFCTRLFGNELTGSVEVAWRNGNTGNITQAVVGPLDNLEELIERGVQENRKEGQNLYIGACLRKPETKPYGRANGDDVLCATAYWCDLDDAQAVAHARPRCGGAPANLAVITGKVPAPRAQLWWCLDEAERDLDAVCRQNEAIAARLGGDPAVTDKPRLMRMPGSISWPVKPGRVLEMTELREWPERKTPYINGAIAKAFPLLATTSEKATVNGVFGKSSDPERWVRLIRDGCNEHGDGSDEAGRNVAAAGLIGHLLARNVAPEEAWEILCAVNDARFRPPLSDHALSTVFESICTAELKRKRSNESE